MITENAQLSLETENEFTLLHLVARFKKSELKEEEINLLMQIAIKLLENEININVQAVDHFTAIHYAVKSENLALLQLLIVNGGNVHLETSKGKSALFYACKLKDLSFFHSLTPHSPESNIKSLNNHSTSLHEAIAAENIEIVQYIFDQFIAKYPNYDLTELFGVKRMKDQSSPLYLACSIGNIEIVQFLCTNYLQFLEKITKQNTLANKTLLTPTLPSIDRFHYSDEGLLTQFYFFNNGGKTPLYIACEKFIYKHYLVVDYLLHHARLDFTRYWNDKSIFSPLLGACSGGSLEIAQLLIEFFQQRYPAQFDTMQYSHSTNSNLSLLTAAILSSNIELVKLISRYSQGDENSLILCAYRNYYDMAKYLLVNNICRVDQTRAKDNLTPLFMAAQLNNLPLVKLFLSHGATMKTSLFEHKFNPLYIAAQKGYIEMVKFMIEDTVAGGRDLINDHSHRTSSPLLVACEQGHQDVVVYLIKQSADVTFKFNGKNIVTSACVSGNMQLILLVAEIALNYPLGIIFTPRSISLASIYGHTHVVRYLYGKGIYWDELYEGKFTCFYLAAQNGHLETLEYLYDISNGKLLNMTTEEGLSPLFIASLKGNRKVVEFLLEKGADSTVLFKRADSALTIAIQFGHKDIVELLLNYNRGVANLTPDSPIYFAVNFERMEILNYLLEEGLDFRKVNKGGFSPFHLACEKGTIEIILLLLQYGVDPFHYSKFKITPLHIAVSNEREFVVRILLSYPHSNPLAFINATSERGSSALSIAVAKGNFYLMKLLIEFGADVYQKSKDKELLYFSLFQPSLEIVDYIISVLKLNGVNDRLMNEKFTPLSLAAQIGNISLVKYLLDKGADIHLTNRNSGFPLFLACQNGKEEMVEYLLSMGANPSQKFKFIHTPKSIALFRGFPKVVAILDKYSSLNPQHE